MKLKVLYAEDEPFLASIVSDGLKASGYEVFWADDGRSALEMIENLKPDICVLDIMMPYKDGYTVAENIRKMQLKMPIIFLSAKSQPEEVVMGFKSGANDYLRKPFSMEELLLRIEVFLRRSGGPPIENGSYSLGSFQFDCPNLTLHHPSGVKSLTQKEAELLQLLCLNKDRVLKREEILRKVWGDDDYFMGRSMDVFISKLRKYLKDDSTIQIVNYHGVGFKLEVK